MQAGHIFGMSGSILVKYPEQSCVRFTLDSRDSLSSSSAKCGGLTLNTPFTETQSVSCLKLIVSEVWLFEEGVVPVKIS